QTLSAYVGGVACGKISLPPSEGYTELTLDLPVGPDMLLEVLPDDVVGSSCLKIDYMKVNGTKYEAESAALDGGVIVEQDEEASNGECVGDAGTEWASLFFGNLNGAVPIVDLYDWDALNRLRQATQWQGGEVVHEASMYCPGLGWQATAQTVD